MLGAVGMLKFGPYNLPNQAKDEVASNSPTTQARMVSHKHTGAEVRTQGSGVFHYVILLLYLRISWSLTCILMGTVKPRHGFEILELMFVYTEMKEITRQPSTPLNPTLGKQRMGYSQTEASVGHPHENPVSKQKVFRGEEL